MGWALTEQSMGGHQTTPVIGFHFYWLQTERLCIFTHHFMGLCGAWTLKVFRDILLPGGWVMYKLLFQNPVLCAKMLLSPSLKGSMVRNGLTKLCHLRDSEGWVIVVLRQRLDKLC